MVIANRPSKITLPVENKGWNTVLDFLIIQFPLIEANIWRNRISMGKVHWLSGELINEESVFKSSKVLCYYREVEEEPIVPFKHQIIFQNEHFIVVDKPHFLPVTPGGKYVTECLLERLRHENFPDIVPMHRLDRETAGLVLFSINKESRGLYCQLFNQQKISKTYQAVAKLSPELLSKEWINNKRLSNKQLGNWTIANRLEKSMPKFIMHEVPGLVNAQSTIKLIKVNDQLGLFELQPITGKTHQLRIHMMSIGMPIENDKFYPTLKPKVAEVYLQPLQLLAQKLKFEDPITGEQHSFCTAQQLEKWSN